MLGIAGHSMPCLDVGHLVDSHAIPPVVAVAAVDPDEHRARTSRIRYLQFERRR